MGLFDKLFGSSNEPKEEESTSWIDLVEMGQLDEIVGRSKMKTQLIFKHSTRCGISRMVLGQFKKDYPFSEREVDLYYLDLITYREISNAIMNRFDVVHESPQLVVMKNGTVVAHASHGKIHDLELANLLT